METEIKNHFTATCRLSKLRKVLLREENLNLIKLQEISRNEEIANRQTSDFEQEKLKDPENLLNLSREHKGRQANKKCFKCEDNFYQGHLKNSRQKGKFATNVKKGQFAKGTFFCCV